MYSTFNDQEPMTLGSPQAMSPGAASSPQSQQYLPQFLLGDTPDQFASGSSKQWSTPNAGLSERLSRATPALSTHSTAASISRARENISARSKEKAGAPPVHGLFSAAAQSPLIANNQTQQTHNASHLTQLTSTPMQSSIRTSDVDASLIGPVARGVAGLDASACMAPPSSSGAGGAPSPAQLDPFYSQGDALSADDVLDTTWVTVFGFPPSAAAFILQEFSQYGTVVKHVVSADGNWMHLQYLSSLQARKALSKSGKVFANKFMVGVSQCIDKSVMGSGNSSCVSRTKICSDEAGENTSFAQGDRSLAADCSLNTSRRLAGVRPLTAAYRASAIDSQVVANSGTPKKSSGIVAKAMEYVFGW